MSDGSPPHWPSAPADAGLSLPNPTLRHLRELSGPYGLFEHARFRRARPDCGYCTDDAGRALALACRLPGDPYAEQLAEAALAFLQRAHIANGNFRLRLQADGHWAPGPPSDDASGRALLGLGVAASVAPWEDLRGRASALFQRARHFSSPAPRASAYAAVGAAELLRAPGASESDRLAARQVLESAEGAVTTERPSHSGPWRWPEPRLTYANALLPGAALEMARALGRDNLAAEALDLLAWLVEEETLDGHFSFAPVGGRGPGGAQPAWDQQPIEACAMAHACSVALELTGDDRWRQALWAAIGWWLGHNDTGALMWDPASGGGYDGLRRDGVNLNQGAESTIAFVATMALAAQARSLQ
ncbi:MAG: glycosyltransferase [Acidimicrobiales bacterium]